MFKTEIDTTKPFPVIYLVDESSKTKAEIYSFGALLNAFTIRSINIIDGFASREEAIDHISNGFKSAKLSPFVCRMKNGEYGFADKKFKIKKFYIGNEAIHGLLFDAVFEIKEYNSNNEFAWVQMQYDYSKKEEGFPFSYTCIVKYILERNNLLSITTIIKNNDNKAMPLSDGWHPYFTFGQNINELSFEINSNQMLEFSDELLPTGRMLPFKKFQQPEIIGETFLDNSFVINDLSKPACILKNKSTGMRLSIHPGISYPILQVYTPPHRKSIAIENLSSAPDAFNNKISLLLLQPGEEKTFTTSYSVSFTL